MRAVELITNDVLALSKEQRDNFSNLIVNAVVAQRRQSSRRRLTKSKFVNWMRRQNIDVQQCSHIVILPQHAFNMNVDEIHHACRDIKKWIVEWKTACRQLQINQIYVQEIANHRTGVMRVL